MALNPVQSFVLEGLKFVLAVALVVCFIVAAVLAIPFGLLVAALCSTTTTGRRK